MSRCDVAVTRGVAIGGVITHSDIVASTVSVVHGGVPKADVGKLVPSQIAAEVTQGVAAVAADIMTPEEWAKQWVERTTRRVTR